MRRFCLTLAGLLAASPAAARELFVVESEGPGGGGAVQRGGSEVFELLDDALRAEGAFAGFFGADQRVSLDYAGVADAAEFDVAADGRSATLRLDGIGFTRTFRGRDREDLVEGIQDYFEEEGSGVYADYLAYLRREALIGAVDGNPDAATAQMAAGSFRRHALPGPEALGGDRALTFRLDEGAMGWARFTGTGGSIDADGFGGGRFTGTLEGGIDLSDFWGLTGAYSFGYRDIEGAGLWHSGLEVGVPLTLLGRRAGSLDENALSLRLTPVLQLGSAGSGDTGDLGAFLGYGVNAAGAARVGDLTFSAGAGIVGYSGLSQTFLDYDDRDRTSGPFLSSGVDRDELDTELDQAVASLGVGVLWRPGNAFSIDAGLAHHRHLGDAAVEAWWSPSAGVAFTGPWTTLRVGYEGTFAEEDADLYAGHAVKASFTWSF